MTREAFESGRVRQAAQDGSREFISLLACISAIGIHFPPVLIYKGEGYDLQNTWVEDLKPEDQAYFGSSSNGWSNDGFGVQWLVQVFDQHSRRLAGHRKRLLIVDGHSSHVNMRFLTKCDELRVVVLILPPHSTHRLQPLDVGLFQPLSTAYSQEVDEFMTKGLGLVSMSKRKFWSLFKPAFQAAFTQKNIQFAFRKAGIWPVDKSLVLNPITRPSIPPRVTSVSRDQVKTPISSKSIRQFQISYRRSPSNLKLEKLFTTNERLAAQHSIDEYTKKGLLDVISGEKKRRQRSQKLGVSKSEVHGAQLFSPTTIKHAQEALAAKAYKLEAEKARIASNKTTLLIKKAKSNAEKAEKALQRALAKEAKAQIEAEKKAEKETQKLAILAEKQVSKALTQEKAVVKKPQKASVGRKKVVRFKKKAPEEVGPATGVQMTSTGRVQKTPQRYVQ